MNGPGKRFGKLRRKKSVAIQKDASGKRVDKGTGKDVKYKTLTPTKPATARASKYRTQEQAEKANKIEGKAKKVAETVGKLRGNKVVKEAIKKSGESPRKLRKEGYLEKGFNVGTIGRGKVKKLK
jgi:hypothetical protein